MDYKKVSITICDDCMTLMDMDVFEDPRIVRQRHCAYFISSFLATGFLVGIFYWTWTVLRDMDEM